MSILRTIVCTLLTALLSGSMLYAEHPIDVQRKAVNGEYMQSLVAYERIPKRRVTTDSTIAAAKSAWALGWVSRASADFDRVLQDKALTAQKRAQVLLSRGIIEYQEGRFEMAALYAEKVTQTLKQACALRSRAWQLWGESLARMNSTGMAEEKLKLALSEADSNDFAEISFALGEVQINLNKLEQARANLEQVPLNHDKTPRAVRRLAQIALSLGNFNSAEFWLKKGRADFADNFLDSWVDYALMQIAIHKRDAVEVRRIREYAQKNFAPSDAWVTLLEAAAEAYEWETSRIK